MADVPGKETTKPDIKAAEKSGPVKPPVLEGTARPAAGKIEDKPAAGPEKPLNKPEPPKSAPLKSEPLKSEPPKNPPPLPPRQPAEARSGGSPWLAGLLGGIVGLGAAYGLAYLGYWPALPQEPAADPRLAQFATTIPELQTITETVQDELSTLNGRVSGLETSIEDLPEAQQAATPAEDFSADIAALSERLDALAETPAAPVDTEALDALRNDLDALRQDVTATQGALDETRSEVVALSETASAAQADDGNAARLPLILSGLESAFAGGRAYGEELSALQSAQPTVAVPEAVAQNASNGLPRPEDVARQLDAVLPEMLAGRPLAAGTGWQDQTADWFRGIIAMRPAGEVEGTSPEAIVTRLEAAVARRDFGAAETEFAALPSSMQTAAGSLGEEISALAAADAFLGALRSAALSDEAGA